MQDQLGQLGMVLLAAVLGGLVGIERSRADKPAGIRTHMLVASAAALIVLLGKAAIAELPDATSADPARSLHAIVTGIGFLGAGTIIHGKSGGVRGLTTAASLFVAAGIGMAVAYEQFVLAVGGTVIVLVILSLIGVVERLIPDRPDSESSESPEDDHADTPTVDLRDGTATTPKETTWKRLTSS